MHDRGPVLAVRKDSVKVLHGKTPQDGSHTCFVERYSVSSLLSAKVLKISEIYASSCCNQTKRRVLRASAKPAFSISRIVSDSLLKKIPSLTSNPLSIKYLHSE